jgi:hypothetical protein
MITAKLFISAYVHMLQYLPPFLHDLWPEHQHYLLKALRHLACIHLYVKSFTVHTDISLASLQDHINKYDETTKVTSLASIPCFSLTKYFRNFEIGT